MTLPSPSPAAPLLTGRARLAAVLGQPVAHSLSPRLHGHWFARYGIDGVLVPLAVRPEDLAATFALLPRLGFRGWNVTLPHKEAALGLVDEAEPAAALVGAVNTVLVDGDGRTLGRNTDGAGFLASLGPGLPASWRGGDRASGPPGPVTLLGAGGAARAVAAALLAAGAPGLRLVNRTPGRAEAVARALAAFPLPARGAIEVVPWADRAAALEGISLLVNATSLGMAGAPPLELDLAPLPRTATVADLVYAPRETALLRAARARGLCAVDGLGMLLHQAVPGFTHWGGRVPDADAEAREVLLKALS